MVNSNNSGSSLSRAARKLLLNKIAKKSNTYGINGKHNRKSLEKILNKATQRHNELKGGLEQAEAEYERLDSYIDVTRKELMDARKDIMQCHDLLRNMDFANASGVRVGKEDDVAYACDGKWMAYDNETGKKEPYSKWKKSKKVDDIDMNEADITPEDEEKVNEQDPDGVDITL